MASNETEMAWRLDRARSSVEFDVPYLWGLSTLEGRFERFDGALVVDGDAEMELTLDVDPRSLDTGDARRDRRIRAAAPFGVDDSPVVRFASTSVTDLGDGRLCVRGEVEAGGAAVPLAVEAEVIEHDGSLAIDLDASVTVDRRRLGMRWNPLRGLRAPARIAVRARLVPAG
jgi:polyisoprenoid-binding protein YceI